MLSRRQGSDEHILLRTHSYIGLAILLAIQMNLAAGRSHHTCQHLAVNKKKAIGENVLI